MGLVSTIYLSISENDSKRLRFEVEKEISREREGGRDSVSKMLGKYSKKRID